MVFFGELHVVIQLSLLGLFGTKTADLHLEIPTVQEACFSKTTQIITEKECA
jgi:hypothetical protein